MDGAAIDADGSYGPATAAAALSYKQKRNIVNRSYQTQADNIVGKMAIAAMYKELLANEPMPQPGLTCPLFFACPPDAGGQPARPRAIQLGLVGDAGPAATSDADIMAEAVRFSRQCLWDASGDLRSVGNTLRQSQPLNPVQEKTFNSAIRWSNLNRADTPACITHLDTAVSLMVRNHGIKTSSGGPIVLTRATGETYWGLTQLNSPDLGMKCGDPFFNRGGPNCRRDVVTHEFFHLIGIKHGGGALMGPTIRSAITTPAQALDSADNLAQLVAE